MKLHLNSGDQKYMIRSCRQLKHGYEIGIGEEYYNSSLILTPENIEMWGVREVSDLTAEHFEALSRFDTKVLILGTGQRTVFPDPAICQAVVNSGIGMEVMNTAAACRTYNIIRSDDRNVVAALIL